MKIGIVLQSNDAETAWNALRFGCVAQEAKHTVSIFLLGKGVEVETIQDAKFNVQRMMKEFLDAKGQIYACGTCLKVRNSESKVCPVGTMNQLVSIVEESDKVLVF